MTRSALFLLTLTAAAATLSAQQEGRYARLTLDDLVSAEGVGQPVLSPDGKTFAVSRRGQIELFSSDGGWPVLLTTAPGAKTGLDWAPDGKSLAFVGGGAISVVPVAGGQPRRLSDGGGSGRAGDPRRAGDRAPQWSPKGDWIAFETSQGNGSELSVVSRDGSRLNRLTRSGTEKGNLTWSPDGTHFAYIERAPEYFSGRLRVAGFDSASGLLKGESQIAYTAPPDRGGGWSIRKAVWTKDGKSLAVVLQNTGWDKIYLVPATGGEPKALTSGESEDESPVFSPDGKSLAFLSNRGVAEEHHIWIANADGSGAHRLTDDTRTIESNPQWSKDGKQVYFLRSSPFEPLSLAVGAVNGGAARTLVSTQPRNFANTGLNPPEVVHFTSSDGVPVSGILYRPLNAIPGKPAPAVLWIHGGPEGEDTVGWDPWALYLAQQGYVVLRPNYRGSSGYGEKFRNLNVEDSGGGELEDVAAGVKYLVAQGIADPKRVGIGGGSHGGTMVAYAVTKKPELFRAAIELYGVVDRASFIERTNYPSAIRWTAKMGGPPSEKPAVYAKANVLGDVPKIQTPLLIMHGEDDPQVPPYESQQFVAALKQAGKPYLYFTYPKELHGFSQNEHRLDAWKKQTAFLRLFLQDPVGRSITSTSEVVLDER